MTYICPMSELTKEDYLQARSLTGLSKDFVRKYCKQKGVEYHTLIQGMSLTRGITGQDTLKKLIKYFDNLYGVTLVFKNNQLVKIL